MPNTAAALMSFAAMFGVFHADEEEDNQEVAAALIDALSEANALELLVERMGKLNEAVDEEAAAVNHGLAVIEHAVEVRSLQWQQRAAQQGRKSAGVWHAEAVVCMADGGNKSVTRAGRALLLPERDTAGGWLPRATLWLQLMAPCTSSQLLLQEYAARNLCCAGGHEVCKRHSTPWCLTEHNAHAYCITKAEVGQPPRLLQHPVKHASTFCCTTSAFVQLRPALAESLLERTKLLKWLLARIRVKASDSNKQYASEILSILMQVGQLQGPGCPWGLRGPFHGNTVAPLLFNHKDQFHIAFLLT